MAARRRAATLGAVAVTLGLSATALGAGTLWPDAHVAPPPSPGFRITGSAQGLMPGVPGRLTVTVRNPYRFPIRVTSIQATARDAGECRGTNLAPARLRRALVVPRRGVRRVVLPVSLAQNAPNVCQGAAFRLVFTGRAVKA